jgi:hypothetical protein
LLVLTPGRELKVALAMRNLTGRYIARRSGLTEWELSRVLNDRTEAKPEVLRRIRAAIYDEPEA